MPMPRGNFHDISSRAPQRPQLCTPEVVDQYSETGHVALSKSIDCFTSLAGLFDELELGMGPEEVIGHRGGCRSIACASPPQILAY